MTEIDPTVRHNMLKAAWLSIFEQHRANSETDRHDAPDMIATALTRIMVGAEELALWLPAETVAQLLHVFSLFEGEERKGRLQTRIAYVQAGRAALSELDARFHQ